MNKFSLTPVFLFIFLIATQAQTTVVLNATKDNTIYQDRVANSNGMGQNFFAGNTLRNNSPRRALIKFDISAQLPAGSIVTSVSFTLFCNKTISGASNIKIHKLLADWGEGASDAADNEGGGIPAAAGDATWVSRFHNSMLWNLPGGDFSQSASASAIVDGENVTYNWASTQAIADVQGWLNNPNTNFGWILVGDEAASPSAKRFGSRENPVPAQRPQLSVTYTTPPVGIIYRFTGNGNWNDAANWSNNTIPPSTLPATAEIIITPLLNGECILNVPQTILTGGKLTVEANRKFRITGGLTIQ